MNKSEQGLPPRNGVSGITNRIVFQLDIVQDTLHYCILSGLSDENRTEGVIQAFQKAIHNCAIVHADDLCTCDRILQSQADGLAITTSDIRLNMGASGYFPHRMYTISSLNAQGQTVTIHGMLEGIQPDKTMSRRIREQAQQDSLFRQAVTNGYLLSMGFDFHTGNRLMSDLDVVPQWLPENINLKDAAYMIFIQAAHPEDQYKLEALVAPNLTQGEQITIKPFYCDCRLRDLSKRTKDFRWYRVHHSFIRNSPAHPIRFYLNIMDIHEVKTKEQQALEQSVFDQTTGMLKRSAFENQVTSWLQHIKTEGVYPFVYAVVILVQKPIEIITRKGHPYLTESVVTLGNTVKAFIHPHEMCGRYGLATFAMVLAGNNREILNERLKMLQMICDAQNAEHPDVRVLFGSNVEAAAQTEYGDVFMEKACQGLQNNADTYARERISVVKGHTNLSRKKPTGSETDRDAPAEQRQQHVFIRTFGHFDVFVDGVAVLFNHPKAKELFALLVDRRGGFVSASEAISCLWEEEPSNKTTLARCRKAAMHMKQTLANYGVETIIETVNGKRRVLVEQCECDYYQYLNQGQDTLNKLIGTYMNEYSWAENSISVE